MREITIMFDIVGTCCQTIKINDECQLTDGEIIDGLNGNGDTLVFTTTNIDCDLIIMDKGFIGIGKIIGSDMNCEYDDFEICDISHLTKIGY